MCKKLECRPLTMSWINCRLSGVDCAATSERIEKHFSASLMDSVASAESFRPVNGSVSGPRWHCQLRLIRQTWLASGAISRATRRWSRPNTLTCCPKFDRPT